MRRIPLTNCTKCCSSCKCKKQKHFSLHSFARACLDISTNASKSNKAGAKQIERKRKRERERERHNKTMKRATPSFFPPYVATHALSCLFLLRAAVCECAGVCVTHLYSILSGCCAVCLHVRVPVCVCCCICIFVLCRLLFTFLHCANTHEMFSCCCCL